MRRPRGLRRAAVNLSTWEAHWGARVLAGKGPGSAVWEHGSHRAMMEKPVDLKYPVIQAKSNRSAGRTQPPPAASL